jgi:hypothetical protein
MTGALVFSGYDTVDERSRLQSAGIPGELQVE